MLTKRFSYEDKWRFTLHLQHIFDKQECIESTDLLLFYSNAGATHNLLYSVTPFLFLFLFVAFRRRNCSMETPDEDVTVVVKRKVLFCLFYNGTFSPFLFERHTNKEFLVWRQLTINPFYFNISLTRKWTKKVLMQLITSFIMLWFFPLLIF